MHFTKLSVLTSLSTLVYTLRAMVLLSISQGKLKGGVANTDTGVKYYEFLGVPYAKPPIGALRFRNPQPPEPWHGERNATAINKDNICCQLDIITQKLTGSEDCLYLNVYTPKLPHPGTVHLPVMVFIHGGGFIYINGIIKRDLGPDYLIDNDVVVVTLNYRLGVLGFLSLDIPEATGNMGLKDQVQALKWVQMNIEKFGGDPNNITIFGISAGSASIDYHLVSPLSKGLFHKAILQSGSNLNHWAINYEPKNILDQFLKNMEYKGSFSDNRAIYEYLMSRSACDMVVASIKVVKNLNSNRISFGFVPVIERDFGDNEAMITDIPLKLIKEGKFHRVPMIKGFCSKEGYMTNFDKPNLIIDVIEKQNFADHWAYNIGSNDKSKINAQLLEVYTQNRQIEDENDKMGIDFFSDLDFVAGIRLSGEIIASNNVPVYFYEFAYDGKMNFFKKTFGVTRKGAAHSDDASYIFKVPVSKLAEKKDKEVRKIICKMWTNFAKTGNPISDDISFQWPKHTNDSPSYLYIGDQFSNKSTYETKKMAIFKEIYDKYEK